MPLPSALSAYVVWGVDLYAESLCIVLVLAYDDRMYLTGPRQGCVWEPMCSKGHQGASCVESLCRECKQHASRMQAG